MIILIRPRNENVPEKLVNVEVIPREGERVIFGDQGWTVQLVLHDVENQRIIIDVA